MQAHVPRPRTWSTSATAQEKVRVLRTSCRVAQAGASGVAHAFRAKPVPCIRLVPVVRAGLPLSRATLMLTESHDE